MFTFFGGAFLQSFPSSIKNNHLLKLGVAEAPVAVGVEPGEDLLDLLLRQVLGELYGVNMSIPVLVKQLNQIVPPFSISVLVM